MKCKFKIGFQMNMCYYLWSDYIANIKSCEMSLTSHFSLFSCRSNFSDCIELDLKFPSPGSLRAWQPQENARSLSQTARTIFNWGKFNYRRQNWLLHFANVFFHLSSRHQIQGKNSRIYFSFWKSNFRVLVNKIKSNILRLFLFFYKKDLGRLCRFLCSQLYVIENVKAAAFVHVLR